MKTLTFAISFLTALATTSVAVAQEGPSTSGGGTSVVCRVGGQIKKAELLDLYEARLRRIPLRTASGNLTQDVYEAAAATYTLQGSPQMGPQEKTRIEENLKRFMSIVRMTNPGQRLPPLNDVGQLPPIPNGCRLEQTAIFVDQTANSPDVVHLDVEIWNALDSMNQAALVSHELFYRHKRVLLERTSESTRRLVGIIYAVPGSIPPTKLGVPRNALRCTLKDETPAKSKNSSSISVFTVHPNPQRNGVIIQLQQMAGKPFLTQSFANVPGVRFHTKTEWRRVGQSANFEQKAIVTEPAAVNAEFPIRSLQEDELSLHLFYQTGAAARMALKKNGKVIGIGDVSSCGPL